MPIAGKMTANLLMWALIMKMVMLMIAITVVAKRTLGERGRWL